MTYTNPGLCHVFQDDIEGGREGFLRKSLKKKVVNAFTMGVYHLLLTKDTF